MEVLGVVMVTMLLAAMLIMINSIYGAVMRRRYLNKERMMALEKGVPLPNELLVEPVPERRRPGNHTTALNGIIWAGIGIGLILARAVGGSSPEFGSDMRQFLAFIALWAWPALTVGIGLLVYAYLIRDRQGR